MGKKEKFKKCSKCSKDIVEEGPPVCLNCASTEDLRKYYFGAKKWTI